LFFLYCFFLLNSFLLYFFLTELVLPVLFFSY
jgi:hypothetical protein